MPEPSPTSRPAAVARSVPFRFATFTLAFVVAGLAVWSGAERALLRADLPRAATILDFVPLVRGWRDAISEDDQHERIALLGDSKLVYPLGSHSLRAMLEGAVRRKRGLTNKPVLYTLAWPAWTIGPQYCLVDQVIGAKPDGVALELNLHSSGPAPLGQFSFPQLCGWLDAHRLWKTAFMPLSFADMTLDKLLFYKLLVALRLDGRWTAFVERQARLLKVRDPLEDYLDASIGSHAKDERAWLLMTATMHRNYDHGRDRATREYVDAALGDAVRGFSSLQARVVTYEAVLDALRDAHVPTLVWVSPLNVDHLRELGYSTAGIDRSIDLLRAVTERRGASFVDFHALLPDSAFRDIGDHVTFEGKSSGAKQLADRLLPSILRAFPASDRSSGKPPGALQ